MAREPEAIAERRRMLGERLATFRQVAELNQGQLADAVNYDRTTVAHIERGRSRADERFWTTVDEVCHADGALVAGFHELEAAKAEHEQHVRNTELAKHRAKIEQWQARPTQQDPESGEAVRDTVPNRELRAARQRTPSRRAPGDCLSRDELAEAVCAWLWHTTKVRYALDGHYIAKLERGVVRWPSAPYRSGLRHILGARSDEELGFHESRRGHSPLQATDVQIDDRPTRPVPGDLPIVAGVPRRDFLVAGGVAAIDAALAAPTRMLQALEMVASGDSDTLDSAADCLDELVAHYSEKLSVTTPTEVYDELLNVRSFAGALLERSDSSTRRRSDVVAASGWLSNLLAVATSYAGDHGSALVWCVDAERRSHESGHREISAWASLTRATMAYYAGNTVRSIDLASKGQVLAPVGTAVHAKLAAHEMRARAMSGDAEGMVAAKVRATTATGRLPSEFARTGVFSIALSEEPPYTATSLLLLNRHREAASATETVLRAAYPGGAPSHNRKSSNYSRTLLILGLAKAGIGDIDGAVAAGREALQSSGLVWPTRVLAGKLDAALMRDHKSATEVADYHALYRSLADSATTEFKQLAVR